MVPRYFAAESHFKTANQAIEMNFMRELNFGRFGCDMAFGIKT
jgi:hypothetical protein